MREGERRLGMRTKTTNERNNGNKERKGKKTMTDAALNLHFPEKATEVSGKEWRQGTWKRKQGKKANQK